MKITSKRRREIKKALINIANRSEGRMPLWTVIDRFTCDLMRDAVTAIEQLEKKISK